MKDKEGNELAILFQGVDKNDDRFRLPGPQYGTATAYFVVIREKGEIRNVPDWGSPFSIFEKTVMRVQWDEERPAQPHYGMRAEMGMVYVGLELRKVENAAKALRKIARIEGKFPVRPRTFGQYVGLLAQALGVKKILTYRDYENKRTSYADNEFWTNTTSEGSITVDRAIREYRMKHEPKFKEAMDGAIVA